VTTVLRVGPEPGVASEDRGGVLRAEWAGEPSAEAALDARQELHRALVSWELSEDTVEDAVLVVSELLGNVVVHARTRFRLGACLRGPLLRLSVSDGRVGVPDAVTTNPTDGRISGLRMITAVASRWGWEEHATGKTIWAEIYT
jgi:hypothetical protein